MSKRTLDLYFEYISLYPSFFTDNELLPLEKNRRILEEQEQILGRDLGIVFASKFYALSVDLIRKKDGGYFFYSRILQPVKDNSLPTVIVPVFDGKFVLIHNFRHPARRFFWEFPRGFNEDNIKSTANAKKEIFEELGAAAASEPVFLGLASPNTGMENTIVAIYAIELHDLKVKEGYEGIDKYKIVTERELSDLIRSGQVTDSFTISGFSRYRLAQAKKWSEFTKEDVEKPYYFVSYSRKDLEKATAIINHLKTHGINVWFDQNIPVASYWEAVIRNRIIEAEKIIFMISSESITRKQVANELALAREYNIPIIPVFLDHVSTRRLNQTVRGYLEQLQYVSIPYLNHSSMNQLVKLLHNDTADIIKQNTEIYAHRDYMYPSGNPVLVKDRDARFYQVEPQDVSKGIISIFELDNQWYPSDLYHLLYQYGNESVQADLRETRKKRQKFELLRALLHSRQILVNRASLYNADVFVDLYAGDCDRKERLSLQRLLNNGSLVLVLYREETPYDLSQAKSDFAIKNIDSYLSFIRQCTPYCLKQDWVSAKYNAMQSNEVLSMRFTDFCMTIFTNKRMIEDWIFEFNLEDQRDAFYAVLRSISERVVSLLFVGEKDEKGNVKKYTSYSREKFYQDFVVDYDPSDEESVRYSVLNAWLSSSKPFAKELKLIIDRKYNENFAYAFRCFLKNGSHYYNVPDSLKSDNTREYMKRSIQWDELKYAISELHYACQNIPAAMHTLLLNDMTFETIWTIRESEAWESYIETIEAIRSRAYTWDINMVSMLEVVEQFSKLCRQFNGIEESFNMSVLIAIGKSEILLKVQKDLGNTVFSHEVLKEMNENETTELSIQFIGQDIHRNGHTMNSWVLFFNGVTAIEGQKMWKELKCFLDESWK